MDYKSLKKRVAQKLDNSSIKYASKVIDAVFESISEGLNEDGSVSVGNWGKYIVENKKIVSKKLDKLGNDSDPTKSEDSKWSKWAGPRPKLKSPLKGRFIKGGIKGRF